MKMIWSDQARNDLQSIREFIARDSEYYARLQVEKLIARTERAARMPSSGHPVHEYPDSGLREIHEGIYRIIYGFDEREFRVITIIHMRQRLARGRIH